jgi:hypothetical protein
MDIICFPSDLEAGLELSLPRNIEDDLAATSTQALSVLHSPLGSPNDEEKSQPTDVVP